MHQEYERQVQETRILQKVNHAYREAFLEKFPGQVEHILRLITERLQLGLDKRDGVTARDPDTWILTAAEILALSQAMHEVNEVRISLQNHDA